MKKVYIQPNMDIVSLNTKTNLLEDGDPKIGAGKASNYPVGTTMWGNEGSFEEESSNEIPTMSSLWDE